MHNVLLPFMYVRVCIFQRFKDISQSITVITIVINYINMTYCACIFKQKNSLYIPLQCYLMMKLLLETI